MLGAHIRNPAEAGRTAIFTKVSASSKFFRFIADTGEAESQQRESGRFRNCRDLVNSNANTIGSIVIVVRSWYSYKTKPIGDTKGKARGTGWCNEFLKDIRAGHSVTNKEHLTEIGCDRSEVSTNPRRCEIDPCWSRTIGN